MSVKASNLTLRRPTVFDVACLVSQATAAGSLTSATWPEQVILPTAMVEFGVNFVTFEALSADTLETLYASLKRGWRQGDDSNGSGEESNEPLISCPQCYEGDKQVQHGVLFGGWNLPTATRGQRADNALCSPRTAEQPARLRKQRLKRGPPWVD